MQINRGEMNEYVINFHICCRSTILLIARGTHHHILHTENVSGEKSLLTGWLPKCRAKYFSINRRTKNCTVDA